MKINQAGLDLIKSFEKCKLTAYKAVSTEKYYTIGWGHYGADVKKGQKITQAKADALLVADLAKFEAKVDKYQSKYNFNSNQYSALVSFAYNVGSIDQLTANGTRTLEQIASKMLIYNKSGGKVLAGLTRRRIAERNLFLTKCVSESPKNPFAEPSKIITSKANAQKHGVSVFESSGEGVKWVQWELAQVSEAYKNYLEANGGIDGNCGNATVTLITKFQRDCKKGLTDDGLCGRATRKALIEN